MCFLRNKSRPATIPVTCCFPQQTHAGKYSPLGSLVSPFPSFKLLSLWLKISLLLWVSDSNAMETEEPGPEEAPNQLLSPKIWGPKQRRVRHSTRGRDQFGMYVERNGGNGRHCFSSWPRETGGKGGAYQPWFSSSVQEIFLFLVFLLEFCNKVSGPKLVLLSVNSKHHNNFLVGLFMQAWIPFFAMGGDTLKSPLNMTWYSPVRSNCSSTC